MGAFQALDSGSIPDERKSLFEAWNEEQRRPQRSIVRNRNWIEVWKLKKSFAHTVSRLKSLQRFHPAKKTLLLFWNLSEARLPKWLRGSLEVRVVKTAWVQIPHLANNRLSLHLTKKKDSAKMSERLRSATQVRVAQASWVRFPLFALRSVITSYKNDLCSFGLLQIKKYHSTLLAQW